MTPCPTLLTATLLVAAAAGAASPQTPPAPAPKAAERPAPEARPAPKPEPGQLTNVRIDLKVTDERGSGTTVTKSVTMTVADRESGSIRTSAQAPFGQVELLKRIPFDVDAQPRIEGNKVRLRLSLQYDVVSAPAEAKFASTVEMREALGLVLESGKPLVAAEAADPISDRRVRLEVTATILR